MYVDQTKNYKILPHQEVRCAWEPSHHTQWKALQSQVCSSRVLPIHLVKKSLYIRLKCWTETWAKQI